MNRQSKDKGGKVAWPSIEQQLIDSKVIPGSALEQLIRDNQDFSVLLAEEANDNLGYPPWLRVYWRKQHPGSRHVPGDPTGGYPGVLETIQAMMLQNQDKPAGTAAPPPTAPTRPTSHGGPKKHGGKHDL